MLMQIKYVLMTEGCLGVFLVSFKGLGCTNEKVPWSLFYPALRNATLNATLLRMRFQDLFGAVWSLLNRQITIPENRSSLSSSRQDVGIKANGELGCCVIYMHDF